MNVKKLTNTDRLYTFMKFLEGILGSDEDNLTDVMDAVLDIANTSMFTHDFSSWYDYAIKTVLAEKCPHPLIQYLKKNENEYIENNTYTLLVLVLKFFKIPINQPGVILKFNNIKTSPNNLTPLKNALDETLLASKFLLIDFNETDLIQFIWKLKQIPVTLYVDSIGGISCWRLEIFRGRVDEYIKNNRSKRFS